MWFIHRDPHPPTELVAYTVIVGRGLFVNVRAIKNEIINSVS